MFKERKETHCMAAYTSVPEGMTHSGAAQRSWLPQILNWFAALVLVSLGVLL